MVIVLALSIACERGGNQDASAIAPVAEAPRDAQHQGITGPHGDHTPHHGGMVLMNGDIHYEVVLAPGGRHQVWFSDAMRNELPASIASGVTLEVARPGEPIEIVALAIDDAGEAWVAQGRPLAGDGVMVKLKYALQGEPHEIELPFTPGATP
jgi:hypothetical protein